MFKSNPGLSPILLAATTTVATLMVTAPAAWAAATRVTAIELQTTDAGLELVLVTDRGDRPQVFSSARPDSWVADIINTQLNLPTGSSFQKEQPAPGIAKVEVIALDTNSIRVIVTGSNGSPTGELVNRNTQGLTFTIQPGNTVASPPSSGNSSTTTAQTNLPDSSEALFEPEITITGTQPQPTAIPRSAPAPVFSPGAIAPPLGDIAVSELRPQISEIDLGTQERVPRLVLRDAPSREVLNLLARAANLNLAFVGGEESEGPTINLDIENEPIEDVFNYVLRLTELEAVRNGRTILVGPDLPPEIKSRNTIVRTLRINQADVASVANFLTTQGAEARLVETVTTRTVENEGTVNQSVREETNTQVTVITPEESQTGAPSVLQGLTVATDSRLNSITLVGDPGVVALATSFAKQLDLRQRQVAVNVKVVDVALNNQNSFSSSFSFGVDDTFIVSDGGSASIRFGDTTPPNAVDLSASKVNPPVIPYNGSLFPTEVGNIAPPFTPTEIDLDLSQPVNTPLLAGEQTFTLTRVNTDGTTTNLGTTFLDVGGVGRDRVVGPSITREPFEGVVSGVTTTPGEIRFTDIDGDGQFNSAIDQILSILPGTAAITQALPNLFQYPTQFLASLQASITNRNAKVLTDPTLVIQENQNATVNLTDKVLTEVTETLSAIEGTTQTQVTTELSYEEVGLILSISVSRIDDNGFITMEIQPRVTAVVSTFPFISSITGNAFTLSVTGKRELNSGKVRLRDGQTLILAGIITEDEQETVTKWPLLGDLPIVGALFRGTSRESERNEVVIVVTPRIMDDSDQSSFGYNYTPSPEAQELLDRTR